MDLSAEQQLPPETTSPDGGAVSTYILPPSNQEKNRLIQQQSLLLNSTDGKLVHAPVTLDGDSSVLETATGSGIWLKDLASIVPATTELIGTDINPSFFPDPSTLPQNLRFEPQSVLELPGRWTNKFDLLHQRLLVLGLCGADWRHAFSEIYRVLKPGGWFQLFEADGWEQPGPMLITFAQLFKSLFRLRGVTEIWPNGSVMLQKCLEEVGFVNARTTWHHSPLGKWAGMEGTHGGKNHLDITRGCKRAMLEFEVVDRDEEFDSLCDGLEREFDNSLLKTKTRYVMICAQKPL